ncbi:MAG: hypothetical protein IKJ85_03210 [Firmicutes bacterium]|nr:hypothetical protein [Bacillota bacterium]
MIKKFMSICNAYPIEYERLREMLVQGFDINSKEDEGDNDTNILSELIKGWPSVELMDNEDAKKGLYDLTKFFVDNGFDVNKYGKTCLRSLCWSHVDKYILHIAELLLDHGAKTSDYINDESNVIDAIEWKLGDWVVGTGRTANTMTAYYNMIEAYESGDEYHCIRSFEECIGKTITSIEKIFLTENEIDFDKLHSNSFSGGLILWCDNMPLFISNSTEMYVDPRVLSKMICSNDISEQYHELIGLTIKDLYYIDGSDGICLISFEDTDIQLFINNIWWNIQEQQYIVANIVTVNEFNNYDFSDIQEVYIPAGTIYSYVATEYEEKYAIIKCEHTSYLIYSVGKPYRAHKIMCIDVKDWFYRNKMYKVRIKEPCLGRYLKRKNKGIRGIVIDSLDKQLVLRTDIFDKVIILLVDKNKYNEKELCYVKGEYQLKYDDTLFR